MKVSIRFEYDESVLPSFGYDPDDPQAFEVSQATFDGWCAAKRAWEQAVAEMEQLVNQRGAEQLAAEQAEEAGRQERLGQEGQQLMDELFGPKS